MTTPLFHPTLSAPGTPDHVVPLQILIEWLTSVDEWNIRRSLKRVAKGKSDRVLPPIYATLIQVDPDAPGQCNWKDLVAAIESGRASPESLTAWRCAELRARGEDARPVITQAWRDQGDLAQRGVAIAGPGAWTTHSHVRRADGQIEDPAARLLNAPAPVRLASASHTKPLVDLTLPDSGDDAHFAPLQLALEALTHIDEYQIRKALAQAKAGVAPPWPLLYDSGVYYQEEPPGHEDWLDALAVLRQGQADCEDLAAWRCAELRVQGVAAEPVIKYQWIPREMMVAQGYPEANLPRDGLWMVHCCVRHPDGNVEDPSKILGMGGNFTERI